MLIIHLFTNLYLEMLRRILILIGIIWLRRILIDQLWRHSQIFGINIRILKF